MDRRDWLRTAAGSLAALAAGKLLAADTPAGNPKQWEEMVDKAAAFLKTSQREDGGWSSDKTPGITGVVLTGLLKTGKVSAENPMAEKALKFIENLVNAKEGHIAGKDPRVQLKNYVTSINVMALVAAKREDRYKKVIADAKEFLKKLQWDEEEGKTPKDDFFGGAGYDSKSRPDLSNTQMFLDALKDAGIDKDDPALKKALIFVSRCQNLKGENNDQPWAGKINDGSFIYSAAGGGQTKVEGSPETGLPGYGSMTYAGVKSMVHCGVSKDDPRMTKALEWLKKHYTLDGNPGMPKGQEHRGLFYYYHTMAKTLDVLGVDVFTDAEGKKHDWRAELIEALAKRQGKDGSWINDKDQWMEGNPDLVTGYALMTLAYCKPKKK
jgi:squalene-hopene/tetraprenyl-beta-curcumene cyclase